MEHDYGDPTVLLILSILSIATIAIGAAILWIALRAYRKHRTRNLGLLIIAVALLTIGTFAEGAAIQGLRLTLDQAHLIEQSFMLIAFAVLLWSVLPPQRRKAVVQEAGPPSTEPLETEPDPEGNR